ncbi:putative pore-forming peptide [Lactococcus hodotermopsidis]|uniref:Putative pore-forming peptide n=1 Tax=Pseudolactococcus hodotermopsidis TaxID=2709157 RepID=A0A6A0BCU0_9LACT|nr:EbsA family protein [Lactococcus hodotermopsidis]GFH42666.1 putative pore-forming peptide [Lactococcus hodotermopsidis]
MIKIFGRLRYHWQPELSISIIYWCLAISPIFISLALLYERMTISKTSFLLFIAFIILVWVGLQRYFIISDNEDLLLSPGLVPLYAGKMVISGIFKIQVSKHAIVIYSERFPKGKIYYMRQWPKKYFVDALIINSYFQGELELIGHIDHYFELYAEDKKSKLSQI